MTAALAFTHCAKCNDLIAGDFYLHTVKTSKGIYCHWARCAKCQQEDPTEDTIAVGYNWQRDQK